MNACIGYRLYYKTECDSCRTYGRVVMLIDVLDVEIFCSEVEDIALVI